MVYIFRLSPGNGFCWFCGNAASVYAEVFEAKAMREVMAENCCGLCLVAFELGLLLNGARVQTESA